MFQLEIFYHVKIRSKLKKIYISQYNLLYNTLKFISFNLFFIFDFNVRGSY